MSILRVALDVPVWTLFDYRCADAVSEDVGRRVVVPFGKGTRIGVVIEVAQNTEVPALQLKAVTRVLRDQPMLAGHDLALAQFASDYYHHPLGSTLMATLPARLRRTEPRTRSGARERVRYVLTEAGMEAGVEALPARAPALRQLMQRLLEGPVDAASGRSLGPRASERLRQLIQRGWVRAEPLPESPAGLPVPGPRLTAEQQQALDAICATMGRYAAHLLLGVTGSGKTEVYLQAISAALATGRQCLLLVPEIALTPQFESWLKGRFPEVPVVSLHSGLNETERYAHWLAAYNGRARIVLGTRLAVFAPLPELGLIVVDEEHDPSFKQAEGLRYSARDLAVVRARERGVPVVLGSATPALETYFNAISGRYRLSVLTRRAASELPRIELIDIRTAQVDDGLSPQLLDAIRTHLARGEQSLVFINRRGYAPVLACPSCGWISGCHRCSAHLVLHLAERRLRCHHCGHQEPPRAACPECGNPQLSPLGQGTQRVEAALARHFSDADILRIDRDSVRPRHAWTEMRRRIHTREVGILVGTQIMAKGHDFPHLNLVGVLNADSMLYSSDFRAPERLFSLLTQVAGRAGRGRAPGRVLIQTAFPGHPLYLALQRQDYRAFAEVALAERSQAGFPPFVHQALLRAEAHDIATALRFLETAAAESRPDSPDIVLYDPVPAAMPRRGGRERAHLLVQSHSRPRLQQFLQHWSRMLAAGRAQPVRWGIDVDPLEF